MAHYGPVCTNALGVVMNANELALQPVTLHCFGHKKKYWETAISNTFFEKKQVDNFTSTID